MRERGRELCGLERSLYNSLMVACGDEVVVVATHNFAAVNDAAAADGVAAVDGVAVVVGATTAVDVWV